MLTLRESATHLLVTGKGSELDTIDEWFAFQPDGFFYAPSYQRWRVSGGAEGWDGWIHPFERLTHDAARILRGHRFELLSMLEAHDLSYQSNKLLPSPFTLDAQDIPDNIIEARFSLDAHQREGVAHWLNHGIGISRVTVSGGKTAMFAAAAAMVKEKYPKARILYVTQAERLVRQATSELKRFLPHLAIGQYGGGVTTGKAAKDIVICTIAMLHKHFAALKGEWFDSFMALFYDEVHHCASKTSKRVVLQIPAYFRFGASDSLKADDVRKNNEIHGLFGPMVIDVKAAPLIERGRIARPHIYVVNELLWSDRFKDVQHAPVPQSDAFVLIDGAWTKASYLGPVYETDEDGAVKTRLVKGTKKVEDPEKAEADWEWEMLERPIISSGLHRVEIDGAEIEADARWVLLDRMYDKAIVQFKERNLRIVEWATHFAKQDFPTLVVCTRTVHILILEALIGAAVGAENVRTLFGEDSPRVRDDAFEWFRGSKGGVLITPLVKEGVSINEIRAGIVADYVSDWEVANQIIGRFIRKKPDDTNVAEIVWFLDRQHPVLRSGSEAMLEKLKRIEGYNFGFRNRPSDPWVRVKVKTGRPKPLLD